MNCFVCDKSEGTIVSDYCECQKFHCHEQCFNDYYDFSKCPLCFSKIDQKIKFKIRFENWFSLSEDLKRYKNILKKIKPLNDCSFGRTVTICIPISGDFDSDYKRHQISIVKQEIEDKLLH